MDRGLQLSLFENRPNREDLQPERGLPLAKHLSDMHAKAQNKRTLERFSTQIACADLK